MLSDEAVISTSSHTDSRLSLRSLEPESFSMILCPLSHIAPLLRYLYLVRASASVGLPRVTCKCFRIKQMPPGL